MRTHLAISLVLILVHGSTAVVSAKDLDEARNQLDPSSSAEGCARAREAVDWGMQVHLQVLQGLLDFVPDYAKPWIQHALMVSQTGREAAIRALEGCAEGAAARPSPPTGTTKGPPSGVPSGPPSGVPSGPPSGVPSGPPSGMPSGPPGGLGPVR